MKLTFYGHASFLVEINGINLLFDPFISPNEKAAHIDISKIKADYILVSHGHEDHVADVMAIAKQNNATIISNYEIYSWFMKQGLEKGHPMNFGGKWTFDFGTVKYVQAQHSSTLPDGSPGGNPGGFIIESKDGNFYYSGDTALMYDMKMFARHDLKFAVLPIGDNFTMGIDDAVRAAKWLKTDHVVGVHYDTFGYIVIDHEKAKSAFKKKDIKLHLPAIGDTIKF